LEKTIPEKNRETEKQFLEEKPLSIAEHKDTADFELTFRNGSCYKKKPSVRKELPVSEVVVPSILQPKTRIDPVLFEALKQSITESGQQEYVRGFIGDDGKFTLYDGHQRFIIIKDHLKLPTILVSIDDITFEEALKRCVELNRNTPLTVQDEAEFYERLLDEHPEIYPNMKAIIKKHNIPQSRLSQILGHRKTIKKIEPYLTEAEKQKVDKVSEFAARPLRQIKDTPVQAAAFVATAEHGFSGRETQKLAAAIKEKKH